MLEYTFCNVHKNKIALLVFNRVWPLFFCISNSLIAKTNLYQTKNAGNNSWNLGEFQEPIYFFKHDLKTIVPWVLQTNTGYLIVFSIIMVCWIFFWITLFTSMSTVTYLHTLQNLLQIYSQHWSYGANLEVSMRICYFYVNLRDKKANWSIK